MRGNPLISGVPGAEIERPHRFRCLSSQRSDQAAVVVVRDLAGAVVELELLQCGKRAVPLLGEAQAALLELVKRRQPVVRCSGLSQEGQRYEHDAGDRERCTDDERRGQMRTTPSA